MTESAEAVRFYQEIVTQTFDKFKKNLPKKYAGLRDFFQKLEGLPRAKSPPDSRQISSLPKRRAPSTQVARLLFSRWWLTCDSQS